MTAAFAQLRMIAIYQLRRLPLVLTIGVPVLLFALPALLRLSFLGMSTAELSRQVLILGSDLGCCLIAAVWAADSRGPSTDLDLYLRGYDRFSLSRSLAYLVVGWLFLGVLAFSAVAIVHVMTVTLTAKLGVLAALTLWLKLCVIYSFIAGLRYVLSPTWRGAAAILTIAIINGAFYASPSMSVAGDAITLPLLSLLAMDYVAFTREFLPVTGGSPALTLVLIGGPALAVMALAHEITGFIGEISSR